MIKKFIFSIFLFFILMPTIVNASMGSIVKVGNKYYETLEEAIKNIEPNETLTLISNVKVDETLEINKPVNINLNGNDITAKENVFLVEGGTLNISGKGTIKETNPNYGAIMLKGSTNLNDKNYSTLKVGKDVTLEGWSGIFITHNNSKSYGVNVDFAGKINSVNDTSGGTGVGIYVNGNIKDKENSPVVNILDGAKVTSAGNGLYVAGYGTYNINEATIEGVEAGIGIKAGILNIDGATIKGTGPDATPTEGYNNGIKASGTSIQIESNSGYAGNIEINIDDGNFISNNSNVIYEYIGKGTNSQVIALSISGGTFTSNKNKEVFRISDSLNEYHNSFISGGKYSSDPTTHLKPGYSITVKDDTFEVTKSAMKATIGNNIEEENTNNNIKTIIIVIISLFLLLIIYLNRIKLKKLKNQI